MTRRSGRRRKTAPVQLLQLLQLLLLCSTTSALVNPPKLWNKASLSYRTTLRMALTPVGPFCPFRSYAAVAADSRMEALRSLGPEFATEFARIQLDVQMGNTPEPSKLNSVADRIDTAVDQWENLIVRLNLSKDFQTREYAFLTKTHLEERNSSVESTASMMRWQAGCMRAVANDTPIPMPPSQVDLEVLMKQVLNPNPKPPPSLTNMMGVEMIFATPFTGDEAAFKSKTVKAEYAQLCRDHMNLIEMGGRYDEFDRYGKIYYLDEIEKIKERWEIFFARFSLLGALDQTYVRQCNAYLASMGLTEADYRQLLKRCHQKMREDAER